MIFFMLGCPASLRGHLVYITSASTGSVLATVEKLLLLLLLLLLTAAVQVAPHNQRREHVLPFFQLRNSRAAAGCEMLLFFSPQENLYEFLRVLVQHHFFVCTQHHHIVIVPIDCLTESQITRGWQFFCGFFFFFGCLCKSPSCPCQVRAGVWHGSAQIPVPLL